MPLALFQIVIGTLAPAVAYGIMLAGVFKLFQIATYLGEVKELLQDIKRNTQDVPPSRSVDLPYTPLTTALTGREPTGMTVSNAADL